MAVSIWAHGALFLTAWLIYLVDRLADALSLQANSPRSARQHFCLRHKKLWLGLIPVVGSIDAEIILLRLNRDVITSRACLGGVAALYLAVNYAFNEVWEVVPLKEITVGFLFSAGTLLVISKFTLVPLNVGRSLALLAMLLFAILCSLNCMSIAVWERDLVEHSRSTRSLPDAQGLAFRYEFFALSGSGRAVARSLRQFTPSDCDISFSRRRSACDSSLRTHWE